MASPSTTVSITPGQLPSMAPPPSSADQQALGFDFALLCNPQGLHLENTKSKIASYPCTHLLPKNLSVAML